MICRSAKLTQYALAGILAGSFYGCKSPVQQRSSQPSVSSAAVRDSQKLYFQDWQIKMLLTSREYRGGELCANGAPVDFKLDERIDQRSQRSFYEAGARELLAAAKGEEFLSLSEEKQQAAVNYLAAKIKAVGAAQDHSFHRLLSEDDKTEYRNYCQDNSRPLSFLVDLKLPVGEIDLALAAAAEIKTEYQLIITDPLILPVAVQPDSAKRLTLAFRIINGRRPELGRMSVELGGQGVTATIISMSGGGRGVKIDHCLIDEDELIVRLNLRLDKNIQPGRRDLTLLEEQTVMFVVKNALVIVPPSGSDLPKCTSYFSTEDRYNGKCK